MDIDHMLNGQSSRERHQEIIRQVQYARFARRAQAAQQSERRKSPVRAMLVTLINLVVRS